MSSNFEKVKGFLLDLDMSIVHEDESEELVIVEDPENGIQNLVVDCEQPIVIFEMPIVEIDEKDTEFYKRLLQINRTLVHGAFVLDENGTRILFRDTLQLENLDFNELEGTISALSLAMAEYANEFIEHAKR